MGIKQLRDIYDEYQRRQDSNASAERDVLPYLVRYYVPSTNFGFVLYSYLGKGNADSAIQECIEYYTKKQCDFEWKYFDYDSPKDLPERLLKHGFTPEEPEAVMILDINKAPKRLLETPKFDVRRASTLDQLNDADTVQAAVWQDEPRQKASERVKVMWDENPDSVSLYIAYVDDKPVSFGRIEFPQGDNPFASIWAGATLPAYRGRGIYTSVVAARLQEAKRRRRKYLTVDAKPDTSMPILQKLGFTKIAEATAYNWTFKRV